MAANNSTSQTKIHQYQPPHQIHHIFAKLDRLLDKMESRIDAVDRRADNLRRRQYPSSHQSGRLRNTPDGYFSRHPEDATNRCIGDPRAPPLPEPPPHPTPSPPYVQRTHRSYLHHSQPPPARSSSSGYTARHFLPPKKQTCWDLPVPRQYVGSPVSDAPPARPTRRWDQPVTRIRQQVSAYEPPPPTGWPPRPQSSSVRQPTCWDPPEQQGYPPHVPPTLVEPLDRECAKFRRFPQQLQPHRYRREVDEDICYGEVVTHTHSPTLDGNEELWDSEDSILEEEHCENLGNMILMDSKSETEVEEECGADASNLDATGVSISSIALLDEKYGVEEDRDVSPADHPVSASKEIYWSCSSDVNNILSTAPLPAAALLSDVNGDFKCLLQGLLQLDLHVPDAEVCKWRRSLFDYHISPALLSFYGGDEGRSSIIRCVFDPGGDVSPKLLLSTLFVASWFPP